MILEDLTNIKRSKSNPFVIAIDGRAAAGKTTFAKNLALLLDTKVIYMDDFFLPKELRTPERLAQPGGNIHYERFAHEVLLQLRSGLPFEYQIYDCFPEKYIGTSGIPPSQWMIVEGAYSHHQYFGEYMDLRVFADIDQTTQMQRIEEREGKEKAIQFAEKWIPLEEMYFKTFKISEMARVTVNLPANQNKF